MGSPRAIAVAIALAAARNASAGPIVSAELPVTQAPVGDAPFPLFAAPATDGTDFVVAWIARRNDDGADELMASRVSASGQLLDPTGILVDTGGPLGAPLSAYGVPAVRYDGTSYWLLHGGLGISGAQLSPSGAVGSPVLLASTQPGPCHGPKTAEAPGEWLVAWDDGVGDILAARESPSGASVDATPLTLTAGTLSHGVAPGFDGTNFVVAWVDGPPTLGTLVRAARVSAAGMLLDSPPLVLSPDGGVRDYVGTSCFGGACLSAWCDSTNAYQPAFAILQGGVVTSSGVTPRIINDTAPSLVSVTNDGASFFISWSTGNFPFPIAGVHVSPMGVVAENAPIQLTPAPDGGVIGAVTYGAAFSGARYLLAWADLEMANDQIRIHESVLDADGGPQSTLVVSRAPPDLYFPSIAVNAGNTLVGWWSDSDGSGLGAALLAASGSAATIIQGLPSDPSFNQWGYPQVSANGDGFVMAAAAADAGLVELQVSATGALVDLQPMSFAAGPAVSAIVCASNPPDSLFVWDQSVGAGYAVFAATFLADGGAGAPLQVPGSDTVDAWPAAVGDGTGYWLAWATPDAGVVALRLDANGAALDAAPRSVLPAAQGQAALAFDGTSVLAAALDASGEVWASLLSADGTATAPFLVAPSTANQVVAAGQPGEFLVLWESAGSGGVMLNGARLDSDGGVDPQLFFVTSLSPSPLQRSQVAMAAAGPGQYLVAYDRFDLATQAMDTWVRALDTSDGGGAPAAPMRLAVSCGCAESPAAVVALAIALVAHVSRRPGRGLTRKRRSR